MDPITLFAMANAAVSAVKKGCQLYKDIKGAAGDVSAVLKDLDQQFREKTAGKPVSKEQKRQYEEERTRIVELSKHEPDDIYTTIGEELGVFFENMAKIQAVFEEELRKSKEVYTGTDSIGKRALQRVLMETKLQKMEAELREIMVYNCPSELGDLYTRVQKASAKIKEEQAIALKEQAKAAAIAAKKRAIRNDKMFMQLVYSLSVVFIILLIFLLMHFVVQDRIEKYPQLGDDWLPKSEARRRYDSLPKKYIGR